MYFCNNTRVLRAHNTRVCVRGNRHAGSTCPFLRSLKSAIETEKVRYALLIVRVGVIEKKEIIRRSAPSEICGLIDDSKWSETHLTPGGETFRDVLTATFAGCHLAFHLPFSSIWHWAARVMCVRNASCICRMIFQTQVLPDCHRLGLKMATDSWRQHFRAPIILAVTF